MHGVGVYAGPDRPPDASWGDEGERLPKRMLLWSSRPAGASMMVHKQR